MRFLLDQGLPRSTIQSLANLGIAAEHVGDLGLAGASDNEILNEAIQRKAVIVTLDADFHALLAMAGASEPSTIRIRIEGLKGDQLAQILSQVLTNAKDEIAAGAVVSVTKGRIRVRSLPLR